MNEVATTDEQESHPPVQPRIIYEEVLNTAPYTVSVDQDFLGQILLDQGWGNEDISGLEVLVKRGGDYAVELGKYDSERHQVRFNTQWLWNHYHKATELAEKLSLGELRPNSNQFKDLLTTKRLSNYLSVAPRGRGLTFANKLFQQAVERRLNRLVLHEFGHADDEHNPNKDYGKLKRQEIINAIQVFGGALLLDLASIELIEGYSHASGYQRTAAATLISLAIAIKAFTTARKLSPSERSADEFVGVHSSEAVLNSLITFTPK